MGKKSTSDLQNPIDMKWQPDEECNKDLFLGFETEGLPRDQQPALDKASRDKMYEKFAPQIKVSARKIEGLPRLPPFCLFRTHKYNFVVTLDPLFFEWGAVDKNSPYVMTVATENLEVHGKIIRELEKQKEKEREELKKNAPQKSASATPLPLTLPSMQTQSQTQSQGLMFSQSSMLSLSSSLTSSPNSSLIQLLSSPVGQQQEQTKTPEQTASTSPASIDASASQTSPPPSTSATKKTRRSKKASGDTPTSSQKEVKEKEKERPLTAEDYEEPVFCSGPYDKNMDVEVKTWFSKTTNSLQAEVVWKISRFDPKAVYRFIIRVFKPFEAPKEISKSSNASKESRIWYRPVLTYYSNCFFVLSKPSVFVSQITTNTYIKVRDIVGKVEETKQTSSNSVKSEKNKKLKRKSSETETNESDEKNEEKSEKSDNSSQIPSNSSQNEDVMPFKKRKRVGGENPPHSSSSSSSSSSSVSSSPDKDKEIEKSLEKMKEKPKNSPNSSNPNQNLDNMLAFSNSRLDLSNPNIRMIQSSFPLLFSSNVPSSTINSNFRVINNSSNSSSSSISSLLAVVPDDTENENSLDNDIENLKADEDEAWMRTSNQIPLVPLGKINNNSANSPVRDENLPTAMSPIDLTKQEENTFNSQPSSQNSQTNYTSALFSNSQ